MSDSIERQERPHLQKRERTLQPSPAVRCRVQRQQCFIPVLATNLTAKVGFNRMLLSRSPSFWQAPGATIEEAGESLAKIGEVVSLGLAVADADIARRDPELLELTRKPGFVYGSGY